MQSSRDENIVSGQVISNILCICEDCMAWVDTTPKEVSTARIIKKTYPRPESSGYCSRIEK